MNNVFQVGHWAVLVYLLVLGNVLAQYPPPLDSISDVTVLESPANENITIRFKSPLPGTCTTVFATQKQYTGYVTIPPDDVVSAPNDYPINTFFWFIEARQVPEKAPLTIWINGGPGSSSMIGLFQENGPCEVVEIAKGKLGTRARDWGWDRSSNMLYIDQPVQVGFSFDTLANISLNLLNDVVSSPPVSMPEAQPEYTFLNGTLASLQEVESANTTTIAAEAIWHFLQTFLSAFPEYNPGNRSTDSDSDSDVGINLFTESYGGKYGPTMAKAFQSHNEDLLRDPAASQGILKINLVSLGIVNGLVDTLVQTPYAGRFAYNNTYGIKIFNLLEQQTAASAFLSSTGCQQLVESCRTKAEALDPDELGTNTEVNEACSEAHNVCYAPFYTYDNKDRSVYDISQSSLDPFPNMYYLDYLNSLAVQSSIGTPVNFTQSSSTVQSAFQDTGDEVKSGQIADLVALLDSGVRVALIYGDRDFICNWVGGEAVSFAVAGALQPQYSSFYQAGYAPIIPNSTYIGGVVRQYGNLSFSRIYDAGHLVPSYQPETAFTIFTRIIQGEDISTGEPIDASNFGSFGPANATHLNEEIPDRAKPKCFLRNVQNSCDRDQQNMLASGAGVVINGVLYADEDDWDPPERSVALQAGEPGKPPVSAMHNPPPTRSGKGPSATRGGNGGGGNSATTVRVTSSLPTGVYTATAIPTTTSKRGAAARCGSAKYGNLARLLLVSFAMAVTVGFGSS